jgi:hypothetical protein
MELEYNVNITGIFVLSKNTDDFQVKTITIDLCHFKKSNKRDKEITL